MKNQPTGSGKGATNDQSLNEARVKEVLRRIPQIIQRRFENGSRHGYLEWPTPMRSVVKEALEEVFLGGKRSS